MAPPPIPVLLPRLILRQDVRSNALLGRFSSEDRCPVAASATTSRCSPPARIGRSSLANGWELKSGMHEESSNEIHLPSYLLVDRLRKFRIWSQLTWNQLCVRFK
ncbi:unnamed protein product [Musa acuminata subsp. malaccensis]|uniref:(wild Malaysian banana) hypothetical protein n=1 Tax=Musa acuminata subsp. malaccensis TaxID=214687 RepID=A0A804IYS6_MUSAM|nr:unnamed protein product [Musa acuminata subsp. malaccensis]